MKKTKYCQNIGARHLREKESTSSCYCIACTNKIKNRLATIEKQGGAIVGLRAARQLAGGSFGFERSESEKERNLRAFFYYVMPYMPDERVNVLAKQLSRSSTSSFCTNDGIKTVKHY